MVKNYIILFLFIALCGSFHAWSQERNIWSRADSQTYNLSSRDLKLELKEISNQVSSVQGKRIKVSFPLADGQMVDFLVKENRVMDSALAKKFPNNKSYSGMSVSNPNMRIHFSVNELGLHAMITSHGNIVQYIDPFKDGSKIVPERYEVITRSNFRTDGDKLSCFTEFTKYQLKRNVQSVKNFDQKLRTYRLALSATGEYSQYHISAAGAQSKSEQEQKAVVLAAMTTALTRVNALFQNELAIRFQLVENNEDLIFLTPGDPFKQGDSRAEVISMSNTNHYICNQIIGSDNYEIGHVLGTQGIGFGEPFSVCNNSTKGKGVSGSPHPIGEYFYFDMIAHEFAHQFGANHTFNGNEGNCGSGRNNATAVEPGSGTSIMGYAGYCTSQNVQAHSDLYFHAVSLQEIRTFIASLGGECPAQNTIPGNSNAPSAEAGEDIFIPVGTPFKLIGRGQDLDGDQITYSWEQVDPYVNRVPPNGNDRYGTLYRSYEPSPDSIRYFPALRELRNGSLSGKWEATPLIDRDFNFNLTVRDNNPEGGLIDIDMLYVEVTDAAGPFVVKTQNTPGLRWDQNSEQIIEWDIAGTDSNGVDVSKVNILLSTDGGLTYPTVLLSNTDNDGSEVVQVPWITGSTCYVMVEAVDNYFFAINSTPFSIGQDSGMCNDYFSSDTPVSITDDSIQGVESNIEVTEDLNIEELEVTINVDHSYVSDLSIELESPEGTRIVLLHQACGGNDHIEAVFADSGESIRCNSTPPAVQGEVMPLEPLSAFAGESARGIWRLRIIDDYEGDTGQLNEWSLNICSFDQVLSAKESSLKDFKIYPNPADESFTVSFSLKDPNVRIELFDILGRKIVSSTFESISLKFTERIETSGLNKGVYFLKVYNGGFRSTQKVILK
jgi:subtilisin-like proprotein convertase family protein